MSGGNGNTAVTAKPSSSLGSSVSATRTNANVWSIRLVSTGPALCSFSEEGLSLSGKIGQIILENVLGA